jgi:hypothetical protein
MLVTLTISTKPKQIHRQMQENGLTRPITKKHQNEIICINIIPRIFKTIEVAVFNLNYQEILIFRKYLLLYKWQNNSKWCLNKWTTMSQSFQLQTQRDISIQAWTTITASITMNHISSIIHQLLDNHDRIPSKKKDNGFPLLLRLLLTFLLRIFSPHSRLNIASKV